MPRESFDRSLKHLMDQVLVLGSMVETAIQESMEALKSRDYASARAVYHADERINEKRYSIESETISLIATQQPMARDVRLLAAVLEIITEIERIGDYAKGICKINLLLDEEPIDQPTLIVLQEMSDKSLDMLHRALGAFVTNDVQLARAIPSEDDEVDKRYNSLYRDLMNQILAEPSKVDRCNHLMWAAHNLERSADRVTNICERIVFMATGEMKEMDAPDGREDI